MFNMLHVRKQMFMIGNPVVWRDLQGLKTSTSQVRFDVRAIVPPVWIERWLRQLIITIINGLFLKGKQKEEVWCPDWACLYDC